MKPCSKYRERIAGLAMEASEIQPEAELQAHLDCCPVCRRYLEEITSVAVSLRAAEPPPGSQPSAAFHRKVAGALVVAERRSAVERLLAQARSLWSWRVALPAAAVAALVIAAAWLAAPHGDVSVSRPVANRAVVPPALEAGLEPTFSNYEMAAHQSLDKLDELLTEQGKRNVASAPIYTAAHSSRFNSAN